HASSIVMCVHPRTLLHASRILLFTLPCTGQTLLSFPTRRSSDLAGAVITPFYDSLLVKACVQARNFKEAIKRMNRVLNEFRIRGVKTNIKFMRNVLNHPVFVEIGRAHV